MKTSQKLIRTAATALLLPFCLLFFMSCGESTESTMEETHEEMHEDSQMMQDEMHENMMHDSTIHDTTMLDRRQLPQ